MSDGIAPTGNTTIRRALTGSIRFVLFGNLFLAAGATVWTLSTYRVLDLPRSAVNWWLLALIFAGVVVVYTVDRLFTYERYDDSQQSTRHEWIARNRRPLEVVLALALLLAAVALCFVGLPALGVLAALGVVSLAYSAPVLRGATVGLKSFGLLKIFLVAAVWTVVTVVLPPLDFGASFLTRDLGFLVAERFLFVFAITLPFDMRDVGLDASLGIRTIPVRIGVRASKALVVVALVAYLALKLEHYRAGTPWMLVPAALSSAYAMALVALMSWRDDDYVYSLLWDGATLVQALLALVFAPL